MKVWEVRNADGSVAYYDGGPEFSLWRLRDGQTVRVVEKRLKLDPVGSVLVTDDDDAVFLLFMKEMADLMHEQGRPHCRSITLTEKTCHACGEPHERREIMCDGEWHTVIWGALDDNPPLFTHPFEFADV